MAHPELKDISHPDAYAFRESGCPEAEFLWACYLRRITMGHDAIATYEMTVSTAKGIKIDATVIKKTAEFGLETQLVIQPYPGYICSPQGVLIRPLLAKPQCRLPEQILLAHWFPNGYPDGILRLLSEGNVAIDNKAFLAIITAFSAPMTKRKHFRFAW